MPFDGNTGFCDQLELSAMEDIIIILLKKFLTVKNKNRCLYYQIKRYLFITEIFFLLNSKKFNRELSTKEINKRY